MGDKFNLKIELRGEPYYDSHILSYRLSPDQDLTYIKEHSILFGLIKFTTKHRYSTKWNRVVMFQNYSWTHKNNENNPDNYSYYMLLGKEKLRKLQARLKTYGDLVAWFNEKEEKERETYRKERSEYLSKIGIWD